MREQQVGAQALTPVAKTAAREQEVYRMKRTIVGLSAAICFLVFAAPLSAHHSFSAVFDRSSPITLTGTVTKIEWMNPHTWFYIDVKNEKGDIEHWGFEMGSPNALVRRGWHHDSLHMGQVVTVTGFRARKRPFTGAVRAVTLESGKKLFAAQDESK